MVYIINGQVGGGNSAFAFIGSYSGPHDDIVVKVSTQRHNQDPSFKPLFGVDRVTLTLKGTMTGDIVELQGDAMQLPGVNFRAMLTRLCD